MRARKRKLRTRIRISGRHKVLEIKEAPTYFEVLNYEMHRQLIKALQMDQERKTGFMYM